MATPSEQAERKGCLAVFNKAINGTLERILGGMGAFIAKAPVVVIVVSVVVSLALGSGVVRLENEERGDKLWVPKNIESQTNAAIVRDNFPPAASFQSFFLEREDDGDVLTPEAFNRAFQLQQLVVNTTWENQDSAGDKTVDWLPGTVTYSDLCLNITGGKGASEFYSCVNSNILDIFGYNETKWATRESILSTINNPTSWEDNSRQGFVLGSVLGSITRDADNQVTGAKVIRMSYLLAKNKTLDEDQADDPAVLGWEQNYLDALEAQDEADSTWKISRQAERSFGDEFGSTIDSDLALLQVAIIAIVIYTYIAISKWDDGIVGSRFLLTLGGIANIGLAILACYGFCSYIGLLFTPLMSILPFIMLGVGVDGMFVLQGALDVTNKDDPMAERMSETMRLGGVSVFVASLTNFGAFMIGSNTSLPALSAFSIYAAVGLLFNLLLQITFFAAVMCIDRKRQERRAVDFLVCIKSSAPENQGLCCGAIKPSKTGKRAKVMGWLGRQYTKLPFKIGVIIVWLGILAAGIYGTSKMRVEADVNNFIPKGSYLVDWVNTLQDNFDTTGTEVQLYWMGKCNSETGSNCDPQADIDFTDPSIQAQMDSSLELLGQNEFVVASSIDSFWTALKTFNNGAPGADFYPTLDRFLANTTGRKYEGDIRLSDVDGSLLIASTTFSLKYLENTAAQVSALNSMRDFEGSIPEPLGINAFTHTGDFLDFEQYKSIGREAFLNIGLGFVMIAIIILLLVGNPVASLLTFLCVASSIVELVGFMYFRGTFIDSVSVIFLVISLGLAVDYSVHVAHGYLVAQDTDPVARMESTMANTGVAVINGAVSTLIAALCLSGSGSYVFLTFFFALLFIVICGAFQGLVVLPVLLDIVRPSAHGSHSKANPAPTDVEAAVTQSQ